MRILSCASAGNCCIASRAGASFRNLVNSFRDTHCRPFARNDGLALLATDGGGQSLSHDRHSFHYAKQLFHNLSVAVR